MLSGCGVACEGDASWRALVAAETTVLEEVRSVRGFKGCLCKKCVCDCVCVCVTMCVCDQEAQSANRRGAVVNKETELCWLQLCVRGGGGGARRPRC